MLINEETIVAIATPLGSGGVGMIRISGAKAPLILHTLFKRYHHEEKWQNHRLYLGQIVEPVSGTVLDEALAVLMRAPHSYTREQVVEFHCHGGTVVLSQVLTACLAAGARLAQRGEFTLRAFLNGALSLDEAEAVADLAGAQNSSAAQIAVRQLRGALNCRTTLIEQELLDILAQITVGVDFPDDADALAAPQLLPQLMPLKHKITDMLSSAETGRIYREGLRTVLAGAVNVGKSSLLNRLLQTERAIVTDEAGATRDLIEEAFNLDGLPLLLTDTAGLRETAGLTETETQGIKRSRTALKAAQLTLIIIDAVCGLDSSATALLQELTPSACLLLLNKADLVSSLKITALEKECAMLYPAYTLIVVSAKTGMGMDKLLTKIKEMAFTAYIDADREPLINNIRHQQALLKAEAALNDAIETLTKGLPPDLAAIDIENAYAAVGEISGKTVSEEVLNNIFANFCLGK